MKTSRHTSSVRTRQTGFTLVEVIISIAVGLVVIASIMTLAIISAQNFAATANYVQMNDQSRNALDRISREIRNATSLKAFSTNNPQYLLFTNSYRGTSATVTFDAGTGTLTLTKTGEPTMMLLSGCDSFSFQIFNRYPIINSTNITFARSTNAITGSLDPRFCKVVNMSWKCSRTILGSKLNTEIVQTAQVVLRNQVTE
jgi:Tfp pilus assembly protein PilW